MPKRRSPVPDVPITSREAMLFEAGIKLGGVFHQYLGIPVSPRTSEGLARAIEAAVGLQPYVEQVTVAIRLAKRGPVGRGRFGYRYLTPEMLDVTTTLSNGITRVIVRLQHRPDLHYSLMHVVSIDGKAAGRARLARKASRVRRAGRT
ncbi:MAG: dihydroneopterin aldolase family protein [Thermoplasmata archaeon]